MSHRPEAGNSKNLEDSLTSWVSDQLGEGSSYMINKVNQSLKSPMEDPSIPEVNPLVAIHPSMEKETNIMTLEELILLRESYWRANQDSQGERDYNFNPPKRGGLLRGYLSRGPLISHSPSD